MERDPNANWIGDWVSPRPGLNAVKCPLHHWELNLSKPVLSLGAILNELSIKVQVILVHNQIKLNLLNEIWFSLKLKFNKILFSSF
jgi:hypothetical protein